MKSYAWYSHITLQLHMELVNVFLLIYRLQYESSNNPDRAPRELKTWRAGEHERNLIIIGNKKVTVNIVPTRATKNCINSPFGKHT